MSGSEFHEANQHSSWVFDEADFGPMKILRWNIRMKICCVC